jgi:hypothetical protein
MNENMEDFHIDPRELSKTKYGMVVFIGPDDDLPHQTAGYCASDSPELKEDPEGNRLYSFTENDFVAIIHTELDQKFFKKRPKKYKVCLPPRARGGKGRPKYQKTEKKEPSGEDTTTKVPKPTRTGNGNAKKIEK